MKKLEIKPWCQIDMSKLRAITILLLCFFGFQTHARADFNDSDATKYFRRAAADALYKISNDCHLANPGSLSIPWLLQKTESLQWKLVTRLPQEMWGSGGTRALAIFDPRRGYVVVNSEFLGVALANEQFRNAFPLIALHESLRFAGYGKADEYFELSAELAYLALSCDRNFPESALNVSRADNPSYLVAAAGGVTSTGGGGDIEAAYIKGVFISLLLLQNQQIFETFLKNYPHLRRLGRVKLSKKLLNLKIDLANRVVLDRQGLRHVTSETRNGEIVYLVPNAAFSVQSSAADMNRFIIEILIELEGRS